MGKYDNKMAGPRTDPPERPDAVVGNVRRARIDYALFQKPTNYVVDPESLASVDFVLFVQESGSSSVYIAIH